MKVNGTIRLRWWVRGRAKYKYFSPDEIMDFLNITRKLMGRYHVKFDVYWNGTWHPCHTITDVKNDLRKILRRECE